MTRRSLVERDKRRTGLVERHFEQRAGLKKLISALGTDPGVRADAVRRLAALPRDSSPVRQRRRDMIDGRPEAC